MNLERRALLALASLTVGICTLVVDGVNSGMTVLGGVAVGCLVLAAAAQILIIRRVRRHSR